MSEQFHHESPQYTGLIPTSEARIDGRDPAELGQRIVNIVLGNHWEFTPLRDVTNCVDEGKHTRVSGLVISYHYLESYAMSAEITHPFEFRQRIAEVLKRQSMSHISLELYRNGPQSRTA